MQTRNRSKPVILLSLFLAIVTLCMMILSVIHPVTVSAVKNNKIEQLIFVQPFSGDHMQKMQDAVESQFSNDGTQDASQHKWVYSLNNVMSQVSTDQDTRDKQAIVIWANTSSWMDSRDSGTFGGYFNRSNKGSDSDSAIPDSASYNGTGFGRLLYGYDYTYEFTFYVYQGLDGTEVYAEDYSANPNSGTDECKDGRANDVTGLEPVYVHGSACEDENGDHCTDRHVDSLVQKKDANGDPVYDADGDPVMIPYCNEPEHHGHDEHEHCTHKTEQVTRTFHVKGVIEGWREQYSNLKIYVFGDAPRSKEYAGSRENLAASQAEKSEPLNDGPQKFDAALKSTASDFVGMFDTVYGNNPYWVDENALKGASTKYYFSDKTYRFIFHMMWNTILTLNPNDEPPENVDQTLYSVSSSLTAYMNQVLSASAQEASDGNTHVLLPASTDYVGNAGAFLGYGDKDYDFKSFITGKQSKTSSVVDYSSLIGVEGSNPSTSTSEMYLYARYGYLLADLGLDDTSTRLPFGSARMIPGAVMFLAYAISQGINLVFGKAVEILMLLNPFQFFASSMTLDAGAISQMRNPVVAILPSSIVNFISDIYDALVNFSMAITIPLFLVLFIAGALLFKRHDTWSKAKVLILRFVFVAVGVPLMGVFYTDMLNSVGTMTYSTVSSGTQMVASTFVDFKGWAQQYRLSPLTDTELGTTVLESSAVSDGGSLAGEASDDSYTYLRRTTAIINKKTGAVSHVDWSSFGSALDDVQKWSEVGLTEDGNATRQAFYEGASLLQGYLTGDFYSAGTWESDVMSSLSKNHKTELGRLQGVDEDVAPDTTNTVLEMFSETNELSKWNGRTPTENQQIFKATGAYSNTWKNFNLFANGGLKASDNKATETDDVEYTAGRFVQAHGSGTCTDAKLGLSTVSMYNYLSTTFESGQMVIYSNKLAPSDYTKQQHYAVNLIGSGVARVLYYMACFSVLFVTCIMGVYYSVQMIIQNVKRGINMMMSIPGAMMGSVRSIASFITITVMMLIELVATMVLYMIVSQLLMVFIDIIETPIQQLISSVVIGGRFSFIGLPELELMGTKLSLMINMAVSVGAVLFVGYLMKRYAHRFVYAYNLVMEYIMLRYLLSEEVRESYFNREAQKEQQEQDALHVLPELLLV